jgi:hypothetical protein
LIIDLLHIYENQLFLSKDYIAIEVFEGNFSLVNCSFSIRVKSRGVRSAFT